MTSDGDGDNSEAGAQKRGMEKGLIVPQCVAVELPVTQLALRSQEDDPHTLAAYTIQDIV